MKYGGSNKTFHKSDQKKNVRGREMVREQMERLEEWENMATVPWWSFKYLLQGQNLGKIHDLGLRKQKRYSQRTTRIVPVLAVKLRSWSSKYR